MRNTHVLLKSLANRIDTNIWCKLLVGNISILDFFFLSFDNWSIHIDKYWSIQDPGSAIRQLWVVSPITQSTHVSVGLGGGCYKGCHIIMIEYKFTCLIGSNKKTNCNLLFFMRIYTRHFLPFNSNVWQMLITNVCVCVQVKNRFLFAYFSL